MENIQPKYEVLNSSNGNSGFQSGFDLFSTTNLIIMVLIFLLVLSSIGVNLLDYLSDLIKTITAIFEPIVTSVLSLLGYTTGTVINTTSDIISDTAKTGIDVAEGTIQNVGNILISASKGGVDTTKLDHVLNKSKNKPMNDHEADTTANPIQNPISSNKGGWCLVGEVAQRRGCIMVDDTDKCMSGQVFPSKRICLNPTSSHS